MYSNKTGSKFAKAVASVLMHKEGGSIFTCSLNDLRGKITILECLGEKIWLWKSNYYHTEFCQCYDYHDYCGNLKIDC